MTKSRRYLISIARLFISTFLTTLILQIQTLGEINTKVLVSLFLSALITTVTTVLKFLQETKLADRLINKYIK